MHSAMAVYRMKGTGTTDDQDYITWKKGRREGKTLAVIAEYRFGACKITVHDDKFLSPKEQEEAKNRIAVKAVREVMKGNSEGRQGHV